MRQLILFLLPLLVPLTLCAQEEIYLTTLTEKELLTTLFETTSYSTETGGKWKPDLEERMNMQVSDDDYCYTSLDTVLTWSAGEELEQAIAIFATYTYYDGVRTDCHACAPDIGVAIFMKSSAGWELRKFYKKLQELGEWGVAGESSIVQIGEEQYALLLSGTYSAQGYFYAGSTWYNLSTWEGVSEIFGLVEVDTGPAGCEEECDAEWCESYHDIERTVEVVPNPDPESNYQGYDDLIVTTRERTCYGDESISTERYRYNGSNYQRICE
ncbi:MAG: hypothetical protein AB7H80_07605 [Candidatus Kapaibacterium sp.]